MCGRITLKVTLAELQEFFDIVPGLDSITDWSPMYNLTHTTTLICIRGSPDGRELSPAKWGFIPYWSMDTKLVTSRPTASSQWHVDDIPQFQVQSVCTTVS